MSKLDELIEKLCPNGVQRYILKDICSFQNGFAFKSILFKNQGEKILRITNINDGNITDKNCVYFNVSDYKEDLTSYKVTKGDIVIAMSGATTGKIGCNYSDSTYYLNQRVGLFRPNEKILHKRYLYHWLLSKTNEIYNISSDTGAQENLSSLKMMNFKIPVPPLEIQNEIVYILDKFTALLAELKAELKARKKQYAYYRDMFVNKEKNKCLIEVLKIRHGKDYKAFEKGNIPVYGSGGIIAYTSKFAYDKPSVLIPRKGSLNKLYYVEEPFWNVDTIFYTEIDETIAIPKYVFYCLENEHLEELNIAGGVPSLTQSTLNNVKIFIPDLDEQRKIIDNLDKLYYLINSLTEGIPAEIEARQKQYEYYRDKLLTFKELGSNK